MPCVGTWWEYKTASFCGIAMLTVLVFGAWAVYYEPIEQLDRMILEWFAASRTVGLDQFFSYITWVGSSFILLPVILAQAFMFTRQKKNREARFLVGACVGGSMLNSAAKFVIMRPRPAIFPALIDLPAGFSFPSAHAAQITAFVLAELLLLRASTRGRWFVLFNIAGGILILLVCCSRLYLQVHYPTDVATGVLTGLLWAVGLAAVTLPGYDKPALSRGCRFEKGKQQ